MSPILLYALAPLLVILLSITFPFLYSVYRKRRTLAPIPGLEEDFLIGHARHFFNKPPTEFIKVFARGFKQLGRVWKLHLLHDSVLFVADPKILEVSGSGHSQFGTRK